LWAGRFFVVTVPLFTHADRLFLHKNNGFLLGIIGTFVGFTMLGRVFLQWALFLSGTILCIFMNRLGARHRQSQLMLRSRQYDGPQLRVLSSRLFQIIFFWGIGMGWYWSVIDLRTQHANRG
jgi:hypothetical protein